MSNINFWKNEAKNVTNTDDLFDASPQVSQQQNNEPKLPEGVFKIKDLENASKYGTPMPSVYFVNNSSENAYVLKEDAEFPTLIEPGQAFIYSIEGAATPNFGVYKMKDFGSIYADKNGFIRPNGIIGSIWEAISDEVGARDEDWIREREEEGDLKWVRLFNSVR